MGMFDNNDLINALMGTPEQQQEYVAKYGRPKDAPFVPWALDHLRQQAPLALMGMRAGPAAANMKAFNPKAPETPLAKRPNEPLSDDGIAQHVYEALLGRTRKPGQEVGDPASGWWHVGGQPIPKPTNVLPWLGAGGVGYGIYKGMGGPEITRAMSEQPWMVPGNPAYEERWARYPDDPNYKGAIAQIDAQHQDRKQAHALGIAGWTPFSDYFSAALTPDQQAELEKYRLPGGVGREPY